MKRAFAGAGLFIVLACTIGACAGDDPNPTTVERQPDPNITPGREGGACTEDTKCLQGLECVRGVICLPPEDGGTSSTDGGTSDDGGGSTDATSKDGDSEASAPSCSYTAGCQSSCGLKKIACDSNEECSGGNCCLALNAPTTIAMACTDGVDYATLGDTHCGSCSGTIEYRICRNDADCSSLPGPPTCKRVELKNSTTAITIGVCL